MPHVAQVNIARLRHAKGHSAVQPFFDQIDEINQLAEASDGFVWRYIGDYGDDPLVVFNLSVWETLDALSQFVYRSAHVKVLRMKGDWMTPLTSPHLALWWVAENTTPSPEEAMQRLELLETQGPTPNAFDFKHRFTPSDL